MQMKSWEQCWEESEVNRKAIDTTKICTFGIKPLDDAMFGMLPNDLIVIGADSGVGKSEICLDIALHNASKGKKVCLYFIEGGHEEAINRIKWKRLQDSYYSNGHSGIDMDYRKWRMNMIKSDTLDKITNGCKEYMKSLLKDNLHIFSFEEGFKIDDLIGSLNGTKKPELIIIDHLQYFTLTNPKNELQEMTEILIKVKNITQHHKIPVVLISHLRKKEKDRGLPSQEDFFGTSNIAKICSQAVVIAPYFSADDYNTEKFPTFFRFVKSRTGLRSSYAVLCDFNLKKGKYNEEYLVYKLVKDTPSKEPIETYKLPKWAKVTKPFVKQEQVAWQD